MFVLASTIHKLTANESPQGAFRRMRSKERQRWLTLVHQLVKTITIPHLLLKQVGELVGVVDCSVSGQVTLNIYRRRNVLHHSERGMVIEMQNKRLYAEKRYWLEINYVAAEHPVLLTRVTSLNTSAIIYGNEFILGIPLKLPDELHADQGTLNVLFQDFATTRLQFKFATLPPVVRGLSKR